MNNKKQLNKLIAKNLGFDPENESECLKAVKENGWSVQFIKNPSEEMQLLAVKQYAYSIRYIKNPSEELQKLAIKQSKYDIKVIMLCPDYEDFADEIMTNLIIKDIIE